jgi:V/A-type H+-transporting ATPase subunit I
MAITKMAKVMIVCHRSQASELLEVLQHRGICQILDAEQASVTKDAPDLAEKTERPKDIEDLLTRLSSAIEFLTEYAEPKKGLASMLAPRVVVDEQFYNNVVSDPELLRTVESCEHTKSAIDRLNSERDSLTAALEMLEPWRPLQTPVEEIPLLKRTGCLLGLLPTTQFDQTALKIADLGAAIQQIGPAGDKFASLVVCLKDQLSDAQKILRAADVEPVSFDNMTGTVSELITRHKQKLARLDDELNEHYSQAASLAENLLKLQTLHDHYSNLLNREQTRGSAPSTQHTVILEAWVKEKDYSSLEKVVSDFEAASVAKITPAEGEEIPVEIENRRLIRPFEVITRLYGMPRHVEVDPTVFLAPFFALFFGLCLTDAGYGLVIIAIMLFFIKKIQGDKKLMWMLVICAAATVVAGALTGGWFGDAIQQFVPQLKPLRKKLMWFDPLEDPMIFFKLALALGYIQIMTGLIIAFAHNIKRKEYISAACDQLTWLVMLNSIVIFIAAKAGALPMHLGKFFGYLALVPAANILLLSHREGVWAGRIGMGAYNLFSTIFYMGDVLSYLRLMALGMVTAGLAMAINVIAEISGQVPYIGIILMILVFVGGHLFNMAINTLGAFVHTLRLQYVEFFPKFIAGGGRSFEPLAKQYKHVYIEPG